VGPAFSLQIRESIDHVSVDFVQTFVNRVLGVFRFVRDIDFAKPGQNGFQQFVFVLYDNEKSRVVAKEFNAPAQSGLGVNGEFVCVIQNNAFEQGHIVALDIGFCKVFEFVANKLDALAVGAIDKHHVVFDAVAVSSVDAVDEIVHNGSLATAGRTVKNDVGDFADLDEILEFGRYEIVFVENGGH
jgi:hypothetical protein